MKRVIQLLPILVILASSSALAGNGRYYGYGPYGYGAPYGDDPVEVQGVSTLEVDVELDPADSRAASDTFPGEGEDSPGFGEWGPSDAGNNQPGNGAPYSGPRPPH